MRYIVCGLIVVIAVVLAATSKDSRARPAFIVVAGAVIAFALLFFAFAPLPPL